MKALFFSRVLFFFSQLLHSCERRRWVLLPVVFVSKNLSPVLLVNDFLCIMFTVLVYDGFGFFSPLHSFPFLLCRELLCYVQVNLVENDFIFFSPAVHIYGYVHFYIRCHSQICPTACF